MVVPKKPNRRKFKKSRAQDPPPSPTDPHNMKLQRFFQANSLRKQIEEKLPKIIPEIGSFDNALKEWVSYGKETSGSCSVNSMKKTLKWVLHSDIRQYPEMWLKD